MLWPRRFIVAAGAVTPLLAFGLAGCSSDTPTTNSPTSFDSCLSGDWVSTSMQASLTVGGQTVILGGGSGERLDIATDGAFTEDDSQVAPMTGSGYTLTRTGHGTGVLTTSDGTATRSYDDRTGITSTLVKGQQTRDVRHPDKNGSGAYTCQAGSSLTLDSTESVGTGTDVGPLHLHVTYGFAQQSSPTPSPTASASGSPAGPPTASGTPAGSATPAVTTSPTATAATTPK